jgi:ubiquinone/menaquinone biosynthesis C-methylase UbiE
VLARRIASRLGPGASVTGIDLNPLMLAIARERGSAEGVEVAWHEGRAEELLFAEGSFDLVVCQQALQFFADRAAALRAMHRVLSAGGRAGISVWEGIERHPFYLTLHESIERRLGTSTVDEIFALGDADEVQVLLRDAGFRDIQSHVASVIARFPEPNSFLAGEIDVDTAAIPAMQHLNEQDRRELTAAISEDMRAALRDVTEGEFVALPFHTHMFVAFH